MTTYRLDKGHWLGSVRVAFWAAHPKKPPVGSQVGSWMIGHSLAKCKVFTGKFSKVSFAVHCKKNILMQHEVVQTVFSV